MKRTANKPLERDKLIERLRSALPEIRERYAVRSIGMFGSYVRGEARKSSDVDILVEFDQTPSLFEMIALEQYLSTLVGVKVDLVMKSTLKSTIGDRILSEVLPI